MTTYCTVCSYKVEIKYSHYSQDGSYICTRCKTTEIIGDSLRIGDQATDIERKIFLENHSNERQCPDCAKEEGLLAKVMSILFH